MPGASRSRPITASALLGALLDEPWSIPGRPARHDLSAWTVTDDWPERVPLAPGEIELFEAWFGDVFDELFGPCR